MEKINDLPSGILIGRTGENRFRSVEIDCADWLAERPGGALSLVYRRPDGQVYPAVVTVADGVLRWTPTAADLAVPGFGRAEVRLADGEVLGKSACFSAQVLPGLGVVGGAPDPPEPDWVQRVEVRSLPPGGRAGQLLYKVSDGDYDAQWRDLVIPPEYGRITYSGFELTVS